MWPFLPRTHCRTTIACVMARALPPCPPAQPHPHPAPPAAGGRAGVPPCTLLAVQGPLGLYWGFLPYCLESFPYDISELSTYSQLRDMYNDALGRTTHRLHSLVTGRMPHQVLAGGLVLRASPCCCAGLGRAGLLVLMGWAGLPFRAVCRPPAGQAKQALLWARTAPLRRGAWQ